MPTMREPWIPALVEAELAVFRAARAGGDAARAWRALERAHILAQPRLVPHLRVHAIMLGHAWRLRQPGEVAGQLFRMALAPLGHFTGADAGGQYRPVERQRLRADADPAGPAFGTRGCARNATLGRVAAALLPFDDLPAVSLRPGCPGSSRRHPGA